MDAVAVLQERFELREITPDRYRTMGSPLMRFQLRQYAAEGLGYLSSGNFAQAYMNWIAQGVNTLSQGLMFIGALLLHRAGLADADALTRAA